MNVRTVAIRFVAACLASLSILVLAGCSTVGVITQPENKAEMIGTKELPEFLKTTPQPSIAMRYQLKEQTITNAEGSSTSSVRASGFGSAIATASPFSALASGGSSASGKRNDRSRSVTETRLPEIERAKLQFIKLLEKELMRIGFTLHDLTLQNTGDATGGHADFLVEIRDMEFDGSLILGEYKIENPKKADYVGNLTRDGYKYLAGYNRFEGWIVLRSSGAVCTIFDLSHFGTIPNPVTLARASGNAVINKFPAPTFQESAVWMAKEIAGFLAAERGGGSSPSEKE